MTFQQAMNQPDITLISDRADELWQNGLEKRSWIKWLNKPNEKSNIIMTLSEILNDYQITSCFFSNDGSRIYTSLNIKDKYSFLFNEGLVSNNKGILTPDII